MTITPYLFYEDVGAALVWLSKAFGFKKSGTQMKQPDGTITHASMERDGAFVMMGDPGPKYKNPRRLGQATQNLYVEIDDVGKLFTRAVKAGATVLEEPKDTPYGHRRCGLEDPEGHQWYFAQPIRPARRAAKRG